MKPFQQSDSADEQVWLDILDQQRVGACLVRHDLEIVSRNREGCRLLAKLGTSADDSRIRSIGDIDVTSVEDPNFPSRVDVDDTPVLLDLRLVDGSDTWVLTLACGSVSTDFVDLVRSLGRLGKVGDMASSIAHRFNNTLTVVLGQAELLAARRTLDEQTRSSVESIRSQGQAASRLAGQILTIGRNDRPVIPDLVRATEMCLAFLGIEAETRLNCGRVAVALHLGHLYRVLECLASSLAASSDRPLDVSLARIGNGYGLLPAPLLATPIPWVEMTIMSGDVPRPGEMRSALVEDEALDGLPSTLKRFGTHVFHVPGRFDLYFPVVE